jgi:hypothetical protein
MNQTINPNTQTTEITDVLTSTALVDLVCQIEEVPLTFGQSYPRRLLSAGTHMDIWLQHFGPVLAELYGTYQLQQIFLAYEMPNSAFLYHKSHPNIGRVLIFSVDNWPHSKLRVMHDPDIDLKYAGPDTFNQRNFSTDEYSEFEFHRNQLLILENRPQSRSWGWSAYVPENCVKRSVWIYLS